MLRKQMNKEESKIEPMMLSQYWQIKWTKNKLRENLNGISMARNKMNTQLSLHITYPNDKKPNEQRIWDRTKDGVHTMRKQRNKRGI